jgi:hypothetical protein
VGESGHYRSLHVLGNRLPFCAGLTVTHAVIGNGASSHGSPFESVKENVNIASERELAQGYGNNDEAVLKCGHSDSAVRLGDDGAKSGAPYDLSL